MKEQTAVLTQEMLLSAFDYCMRDTQASPDINMVFESAYGFHPRKWKDVFNQDEDKKD